MTERWRAKAEEAAFRYALALMRNRLDVEAPMNADAIRGHIAALEQAQTAAQTREEMRQEFKRDSDDRLRTANDAITRMYAAESQANRLREVLETIAAPGVTADYGWWTEQARAALLPQGAPDIPTGRETMTEEMRWQPIETAPKDGTDVLLYSKWEDGRSLMGIGRLASGRRYDQDYYGWSWTWAYQPTHWMPLPTAPQAPDIPAGEQR